MEVVKIPIYLRPFSLISEPAPPMTLYEVNGEYGGGKKETIQKTKIFTRKLLFWGKEYQLVLHLYFGKYICLFMYFLCPQSKKTFIKNSASKNDRPHLIFLFLTFHSSKMINILEPICCFRVLSLSMILALFSFFFEGVSSQQRLTQINLMIKFGLPTSLRLNAQYYSETQK